MGSTRFVRIVKNDENISFSHGKCEICFSWSYNRYTETISDLETLWKLISTIERTFRREIGDRTRFVKSIGRTLSWEKISIDRRVSFIVNLQRLEFANWVRDLSSRRKSNACYSSYQSRFDFRVRAADIVRTTKLRARLLKWLMYRL